LYKKKEGTDKYSKKFQVPGYQELVVQQSDEIFEALTANKCAKSSWAVSHVRAERKTNVPKISASIIRVDVTNGFIYIYIYIYMYL
jgi:hypothetical protein